MAKPDSYTDTKLYIWRSKGSPPLDNHRGKDSHPYLGRDIGLRKETCTKDESQGQTGPMPVSRDNSRPRPETVGTEGSQDTTIFDIRGE